MLPTTAAALSAAKLAHVFQNGAHFLVTSISNHWRAHPTIVLKFSLVRDHVKIALV